MSKQGEVFLRMLLIHVHAWRYWQRGARKERTGRSGTCASAHKSMHPIKAAVALAHKLARIAWAVWYQGRTFDRIFAHAE
jgi:hypothetical protein